MLEKNLGMLLYGPKGTGKTFLACAVANALLEKLVPVCVTSFPEILNRLWRRDADRQGYIDRLSEYKLLVVDDLGAERDTPYACEQVYNVIDSPAALRPPADCHHEPHPLRPGKRDRYPLRPHLRPHTGDVPAAALPQRRVPPPR